MIHDSPADVQPGGSDRPGSRSQLLPTKTKRGEGARSKWGTPRPAQ